jgi:hypothetical protein
MPIAFLAGMPGWSNRAATFGRSGSGRASSFSPPPRYRAQPASMFCMKGVLGRLLRGGARFRAGRPGTRLSASLHLDVSRVRAGVPGNFGPNRSEIRLPAWRRPQPPGPRPGGPCPGRRALGPAARCSPPAQGHGVPRRTSCRRAAAGSAPAQALAGFQAAPRGTCWASPPLYRSTPEVRPALAQSPSRAPSARTRPSAI